MTTATSTRTRIPDVQTLRQRLDAVEAKRRTVADELHRLNALVSPYVDDKPSASRSETLRARHRVPELRREVELLDAEIEETERDLRDAEAAERQAAQRVAVERLRPLIPQLAEALARVVELLGPIAALDQQAQMGVADAWVLLLGDERRTSLLNAWRAHVRSLGLL